jgi:hypothetical protein
MIVNNFEFDGFIFQDSLSLDAEKRREIRFAAGGMLKLIQPEARCNASDDVIQFGAYVGGELKAIIILGSIKILDETEDTIMIETTPLPGFRDDQLNAVKFVAVSKFLLNTILTTDGKNLDIRRIEYRRRTIPSDIPLPITDDVADDFAYRIHQELEAQLTAVTTDDPTMEGRVIVKVTA